MILLVQFRTDQSGWHEVKCVYEAGTLPFHNYSIVNAINEKVSPADILDLAENASMVILGGAGEGGYEANTEEQKDHLNTARDKMGAVIPALANSSIPTLGMCFGHQLMADIFGGEVVVDKEYAETGIAEICLTEAGQNDPLLENLDECFPAVVGHKASVIELPDDAVHLAQSEACEYQAFVYGKNMYGFQFHPELDADALADRLRMYPEYAENKLDKYENVDINADQITKRAIELFG